MDFHNWKIGLEESNLICVIISEYCMHFKRSFIINGHFKIGVDTSVLSSLSHFPSSIFEEGRKLVKFILYLIYCRSAIHDK